MEHSQPSPKARTGRMRALPFKGLEGAWLVLLLSVAGTLVAWRYTTERSLEVQRDRFHAEARQLTTDVRQQIELFLDALRGLQALYAASKAVERDEFAAHVRQAAILTHHPEARAAAFVERVAAQDREAFVARVRADPLLQPEGYPTFAIHPAGERPEFFVVTYLEPMDERVLGFDVASDPRRREAVERARDTGEPTATGLVRFFSDPSRAGISLALPIYQNRMPVSTVEERRIALQGFVWAAVNTEVLFRTAVQQTQLCPGVALKVFDRAPGTEVLYESHASAGATAPAGTTPLRSQTTLTIGGRVWVCEFTARPGCPFLKPSDRTPLLILVFGLVLSLLGFGMLASLATSRLRAVRIAEEMTQAWRTNQALLMARTSQQTAVAELSQQALADVDLSTLFDYAVGLAAKTLTVELCEILELLPDGTALQVRTGVGWPPGLVGQAAVPTGTESQAGYTLQTGNPVIVEDLRTQTRFTDLPLLQEHGVVSGMTVVIPSQEQPFGVLGAHTRTVRRFSEDDVQFLQNIANVLAAAIRRKHLEGELRERSAALEQSLAELQTTQLQLIQAEKLESVGRLAAGVAHEVKNPLAIILMGAEYLTKHLTDGDDTTRNVLKEVAEAVKRADTVIKGLLDFSAPRALAANAQALSPIIDQALHLVKHDLTKSHVLVIRQLAGDLPPLELDRQKTEQVFVNLFTNAIHAMPEGGILTIRAGIKRLTEPSPGVGRRTVDPFRMGDEAVVVEVEDTGTGIPDAKLTKVFDPFFTTKQPGKGTGLGLTIAKKIVELHGGHLALSNRHEGGVRAAIMFRAPKRV